MNYKQKALGLLTAGALLAALPFNAVAKTQAKVEKPPVQVQYVALGDSLAAGQTPYKYVDYGYTDFIADYFVKNKYKLADFDNFGVPGYTSENVKNDVTKSKKIRKEIKEATHITIDIGANDLLPKLSTDPAGAIAAVKANLQTILKTIDSLNPRVKVYVMGYYNPYPGLSAAEQAKLLPLLKLFNAEIQKAAKDNKDTFVATDMLIAKKTAEYLPNPLDIHLSEAGYKAVASEFWKYIAPAKKK
ncbi:SGNH/GDSL hydrolase family protein [Peribacillus deserti]|uniref:SGNH hydrolase-type esterase domain-containing protein n=1 Tax=Peribacillus deserti TaxID=673318 RepID=A0A2N5M8V7_9BACI|nr:GDSL-type esterase/lipase family protein [Peribacillus deserti]PLT30775.1 hypothetical protein CUU66_06380 [Peribacillus deserti]